MGFVKKIVGGVGKVVTGIGKGVASIFTGGNSRGSSGQLQPAAAPTPQPQSPSLPSFNRLRYIGDPPDAPYMQKPWQRFGIGQGGTALGLPSMGGGNFGGMGQTGMGGMGSFGGMSQSPMMPSSPMPSAPNGGQSFYGGASNNVLDRMRMMRQGMGSPMGIGMPYSGIRRSPFGMM